MMEAYLFILTLMLSALFSGAETAYIASNRLKLRVFYHESGGLRSQNMLLKNDQRFLTTTLVGNNIAVTACSSLAVMLFSPYLSSTLLVGTTTVFLLIFGEIIPKSIAAQLPNRLSRFTPKLLGFFYILFYPLIWLVERVTRFFMRLLHRQPESFQLFSKIDLPILVREYASTNILTEHDQMLLSRALRIRDRRLWDIMVPRTDIVGIDVNGIPDEIQKIFGDSGFSRLPVFHDNLDQIEGFLYVRDFYAHTGSALPPLRPALFLPESMRVIEALQTLQQGKKSIAITVDEHGGTAGLVTVEDIVEKLVGSINDEFDKPKSRIQFSGLRTFTVDGRTSIDELREMQKIYLPEGDYVTVAGLLMDKLEHVPIVGEKIEIDGYSIEVLEAAFTKVVKVSITAPAQQE
jgi:putative hemolysin